MSPNRSTNSVAASPTAWVRQTIQYATDRRAASVVLMIAMVVVAALLASGCSNGSESPGDDEITVSAAASLTEAFGELTNEFIAANPGVVVRTNFGSSAQLAEQVISGAPVDVVAFADNRTMDRLDQAGLIGPARTFAHNSMVIVTKPKNPKAIRSPSDLAAPGVGVVALCRAEVPCGTYAGQILESAGVNLEASRITRGQDVKDTLGAVTNGDADAAIVYRTDAIAAGDQVTTVALDDADDVSASYPIAVVERAADSKAARAFVDFVLSDRGREVLAKYGFDEP